MRGAGTNGVRRHPLRDALAAVAVAAALPSGWTWNDPAAHVAGATVVLVVALLVLGGRARAAAPAHAYAEALARGSALHVHLTRARVVCRSVADLGVLLTFTWQGARTDLLDVDGRVLHSVLRNCLDSGYTVTLRVEDEKVADLVARDRLGGTVDVYAAVDLAVHPEGGIAEHGVAREAIGLCFSSWRGSLTPRGHISRLDSRPL